MIYDILWSMDSYWNAIFIPFMYKYQFSLVMTYDAKFNTEFVYELCYAK